MAAPVIFQWEDSGYNEHLKHELKVPIAGEYFGFCFSNFQGADVSSIFIYRERILQQILPQGQLVVGKKYDFKIMSGCVCVCECGNDLIVVQWGVIAHGAHSGQLHQSIKVTTLNLLVSFKSEKKNERQHTLAHSTHTHMHVTPGSVTPGKHFTVSYTSDTVSSSIFMRGDIQSLSIQKLREKIVPAL